MKIKKLKLKPENKTEINNQKIELLMANAYCKLKKTQ